MEIKVRKEKILKKNSKKQKIEVNDKKNNTKKEEKILTEDKKINKRRNIKRILILIFIILVIMLICFFVSVYKWNRIIKDFKTMKNSVILDTTGNVIAELGESRIQENVNLEDVPDELIDAYVSIEDKTFYKHNGVNMKRTAAATFSYVFKKDDSTFGGSTITQQLVKNLTGENETKISRKIIEWDRAFKTELVLSKDEIMEMYLNIIYVGPNVYGVQKGAQYYFDKNVSELDLAECAYLAGINHSPNSYNPFNEKDNSEKIKARTITVLNEMLEDGYISEDEYNEAKEEVEEGLDFQKADLEAEGDAIYSYMVDATISEIIQDLEKQKNMSTTFATNYLYYAGLEVYSTQNTDIQEYIEDETERKKYLIESKQNDSTLQGAMVVIDHQTGQVQGCVGGLGEKTTSRGFNRAVQAVRQTGSAIKPIAILGPAIEENIITPATIYDDTRTTFEGGYSPKNCENELGEITVRRAVESSQNIPFVKIMEQLTPEKAIEYMQKQGVSTLTEGDKNLGLALGGLEKGTSPLEMAAAYATIANNGTYKEPIFYTKIENSRGKTVLKNSQKSKKVYSEETSYIVKKLLTQPVVGKNGTAQNCKIDGMEVAAKTGTTNDNYDKWLCGFTKHYTAVVWTGFDINETINENSNSMASEIWSNVMNAIHEDLINVKFGEPKKIVEIEICEKTGKIAGKKCKNTYKEYFKKDNKITEKCDEKH